MSGRKSDAARAILRRDHQHGETEAAFRARLRETLASETGLFITIDTEPGRVSGSVSFLVRGYNSAAGDTVPMVRGRGGSMAAAVSSFRSGADIARAAGIIRK